MNIFSEEGITHIQRHTGIGHLEKAEQYVWEQVKEQGTKIENILNESHQREYFREEIAEAEKKNIDFLVCDFVIINEETQEIKEVMEIENNYGKDLIQKHKNYAIRVLGQTYQCKK